MGFQRLSEISGTQISVRRSCVAPCRQVVPDYQGKLGLAIPLPPPAASEDPEVGDHRRWFQSACRGFLDKQSKYKRPVAVQRRVSFWWMMCVHMMLVRMCGCGLEAFVSERTAAACIILAPGSEFGFQSQGRLLSVSLHQHSVGWASCFFMKRALHMNVVAIGDFAHTTWNDCKVALGKAGFWEVILLSSILFNVCFGPWEGCKWWRTCQECAVEYFQKVGNASGPLFLSQIGKIATERGEAHRVMDDGYAEQLWAEMQELQAMRWKGPKMALCRWFSWHGCFRFWRTCWSMRALVMMYWGLNMGYLTEEPGTSILRLAGILREPNKNTSTSQAETMREAQAAQNKLYKQSRNQLHVATIVAIDKDIHDTSIVIHLCCRSLHAWHANGLREVRSPQGSIAWHARQAAGECLKPVSDCFRILTDLSLLSEMGPATSKGDLPLSSLVQSVARLCSTRRRSA